MTAMALTLAPLKRLFTRLDYAMPPTNQSLVQAVELWKAAAGDAPMPQAVALKDSSEAELTSFICRASEKKRDYFVSEGREAAQALLGSLDETGRLVCARNRRAAARLRRLIEEAARTSTPFVAQFDLREKNAAKGMIEVLLAPLSRDGKTVDAALVSCSKQTYREAAPTISRREPFDDRFSLFCLDDDKSFGMEVARVLEMDLAPHELRAFEDGEFKIRPLCNLRNKDVYVLASLHGVDAAPRLGVSEKLCRLLFFIGALKDAGASRITVAAPYLCYQRKDRQTKPRDPLTSRYLAQLIEAMGTNRVITMDAHNLSAYQNAFRCDTDHLDARGIFVSHLSRFLGGEAVAVVSPDLGGEKRAELFRERLERRLARPVSKAFMDKHRSEGKITGEIFAGEVEGRIAIVLDDLIAGGGTMARVAKACRERGAREVWCVATHGVFSPKAAEILKAAPIERIVITDTVPLPRFMEAALGERLSVVSTARLFAQAIERCHNGGSLTELLDD
jgi:ribose-phosphate pyrophosphokinase